MEKYKVEIKSSYRKTAGFQVYPEYEKIMHALAKANPLIANKGLALEYLIEFYLTIIPSEKREMILDLASGKKEKDLEW